MIATAAYILFWVSLFLVLHSYIFYPIIVLVWSSLIERQSSARSSRASLNSLLMAVYNEEKIIIEKLENIRNIDYPKEKIEILIGSDCSSDATMKLLESSSLGRTRIFDFPRSEARRPC